MQHMCPWKRILLHFGGVHSSPIHYKGKHFGASREETPVIQKARGSVLNQMGNFNLCYDACAQNLTLPDCISCVLVGLLT